MKRKVCVVTGTRAEFGLMQWIMRDLLEDEQVEFQLIVTGMHLSPEFGMTYQSIVEAGFPISKKIEVLLSSDTAVGISKTMGLGMMSFAEAYAELEPDLVLVLGDRFEIFAAVSAAMVSQIPVGHIHGGEATEGLIDEPIRHSITKMSHLHFTATEEYRNRVIQLGEQPDRVFNTGTPGLDNISNLELLNRSDFEKSIDFSLGPQNLMITFHPVTLEKNTSEKQFKALLEALDCFPDCHFIFTKPNADTHGRVIIGLIDDYVRQHPEKSCAFHSLGQLRYLSAMQHIDAVLGNSSSGLIEVPSFRIPTVNIGDRQKGRVKAPSVIDCAPDFEGIKEALEQALSPEFKQGIANMENPYGKEGASKKISEIIRDFPLEGILKKSFYNIH